MLCVYVCVCSFNCWLSYFCCSPGSLIKELMPVYVWLAPIGDGMLTIKLYMQGGTLTQGRQANEYWISDAMIQS